MNDSSILKIMDKWGFPVIVALATGWILRNDVLLPLVEEHRAFVKELGQTQRDISTAIGEQTRLLYQLAPSSGELRDKEYQP